MREAKRENTRCGLRPMSDKAAGRKTRGPEGCDENGPAAALLLGHVSIQICSLVAPCRRPILIATPLYQSRTWCTSSIGAESWTARRVETEQPRPLGLGWGPPRIRPERAAETGGFNPNVFLECNPIADGELSFETLSSLTQLILNSEHLLKGPQRGQECLPCCCAEPSDQPRFVNCAHLI